DGISQGTFTIGGTVTGDLLAASTAGTGITANYDTATETLTLSGTDTLAHYQQVLDSITYSSGVTDPTNNGNDPTRFLTWALDDGSGSFNTSAPQTTTISIHSGAAIFGTTTAQYTEQSALATLSPSVSVTDTNTTTLTSATVAITSGAF